MKQIPGKIEGNYSSKVRQTVWYNGSKPAKFFLSFFQNLTYFLAFCVIILVEYFLHFMLHECYWILINYSFNLTNLALQFVCYCWDFQKTGLSLHYLVLSFSNKVNYFSLSWKSPTLSCRLLSLLWDYDW